MKKDKDLFILPRTPDSVPTPRTRDQIIKTSKIPVISKPRYFDRALARLKETGKLSLEDFNNAAEVGAFIDFYNDTIKKKKDAYSNNEIVEISKLLARLLTQKTIILDGKK